MTASTGIRCRVCLGPFHTGPCETPETGEPLARGNSPTSPVPASAPTTPPAAPLTQAEKEFELAKELGLAWQDNGTCPTPLCDGGLKPLFRFCPHCGAPRIPVATASRPVGQIAIRVITGSKLMHVDPDAWAAIPPPKKH